MVRTKLSHLDDREYLSHLYSKNDPTDEDLESAFRLEQIMDSYDALLEKIYQLASDGGHDALMQIRGLTQRAEGRSLFQ